MSHKLPLDDGKGLGQDHLTRHESLFKAFYKPLVVYAFRLVKNKEEAEDIVQEVFARVWKKREVLQYSEDMTAYLFSAVKNGCLNHHRHLKVVQQHESQVVPSFTGTDDPHQYMILNEIQKSIEDTLGSVNSRAREVFELSRFRQKKNKEIAEILNISVKTVEAHMSKVLAALRRNLKHHMNAMIIVLLNIL